ncbi:MAG: glycosyltransferase family 2 protein [Actinobacteria bacterium]|jgi:glycosyltransferase involved in cell wall biosynthesis|nr:glycosyltransferase family 2 protein [Actinomycetota bacterium]
MVDPEEDRLPETPDLAGAASVGPAPAYSIVIPVHNEAECLAEEVEGLTEEMEARGVDYELLLAENGSSDATGAIAEALAEVNPRIKVLRLPVPDYGAAMKAGMLAGRGDLIVNFDIDYHDVDFIVKAGDVLAGGAGELRTAGTGGARVEGGAAGVSTGVSAAAPGIVVGSKLVEGSEDRRSPVRHFISLGFTTILRVLFDRHMDDTHGMKVLRREVVARYAPKTIMTTDLFDTELIIRARRGGVAVHALPVTVEEKRKPRSSIARRIPRTIRNLIRLRLTLWKEGRPGA